MFIEKLNDLFSYLTKYSEYTYEQLPSIQRNNQVRLDSMTVVAYVYSGYEIEFQKKLFYSYQTIVMCDKNLNLNFCFSA